MQKMYTIRTFIFWFMWSWGKKGLTIFLINLQLIKFKFQQWSYTIATGSITSCNIPTYFHHYLGHIKVLKPLQKHYNVASRHSRLTIHTSATASCCNCFLFLIRHHTLVLTDSKRVYSFGCGEQGQLGHGGGSDQPVPLSVQLSHGKYRYHT